MLGVVLLETIEGVGPAAIPPSEALDLQIKKGAPSSKGQRIIDPSNTGKGPE